MSRSRGSLLCVFCLMLAVGVGVAGPFGPPAKLQPAGVVHTAALPTQYVLERTIGTIPSWHPLDVCVDDDGYVYFIDGQFSKVRKLAPGSTTIVRSWGGVGGDNGKFREPRSISVDSFGYIYVLDLTRCDVQKFTSEGAFVLRWAVSADTVALAAGLSGRIYCLAPGKITVYSPTGKRLYSANHSGGGGRDIAADAAGNVFVLDSEPAIYRYSSTAVYKSKPVSGVDNAEFLDYGYIAAGSGRIYVGNGSHAGLCTIWSTEGVLQGHYVPFGGDEGEAIDCHGLAVDAAGNFYHADLNAARIQKFTAAGAFAYRWGWAATSNGKFRGPCGIAVDTSGNTYIVDAFNRRVQKFDATGAFVRTFGTAGTGNGQFSFPLGIVLSGGKVFVGDMEGNRIQRFTNTGTYETKWGSSGTTDGKFQGVAGLAASSAGSIFAVDQRNGRVQYFSAWGKYLGQFGAGVLENPWGVAVSGSQAYVSDDSLCRVYSWTLSGTAEGSFGSEGYLYGQFLSPKLMASDSGGNLWVADWDQGWSQQFTTAGAVRNAVQMTDATHPWVGNTMGVATGPGDRVYVSDLIYQQVFVFAPAVAPTSLRSVAIQSLSAGATGGGGASIVFTLSAPADAAVELTNIAGRPIRRLSVTGCVAGCNVALWDGRSTSGLRVPNGMYLVKLTAQAAGGQQATCLTQVTLGR